MQPWPARNLSALKSEREAASKNFKVRTSRFKGDRDAIVTQLKGAIYASMVITYSQGMAQLRAASKVYEYGLNFGRGRPNLARRLYLFAPRYLRKYEPHTMHTLICPIY